jgi:hypothetical protein
LAERSSLSLPGRPCGPKRRKNEKIFGPRSGSYPRPFRFRPKSGCLWWTNPKPWRSPYAFWPWSEPSKLPVPSPSKPFQLFLLSLGPVSPSRWLFTSLSMAHTSGFCSPWPESSLPEGFRTALGQLRTAFSQAFSALREVRGPGEDFYPVFLSLLLSSRGFMGGK